MAVILVSVSDFAGFQLIPKSTQSTPLIQTWIDRYEAKYICELLGVELGKLFIASTPTTTADPRFVAIRDAFQFQPDYKIEESKGMKDFLLSIIFYHYVKDNQDKLSLTGVTENQSEAQKDKSPLDAYRFGERKFNESLNTVDAIQWYCKFYANQLYPNDITKQYPEYKGQCIKPKFAAIL